MTSWLCWYITMYLSYRHYPCVVGLVLRLWLIRWLHFPLNKCFCNVAPRVSIASHDLGWSHLWMTQMGIFFSQLVHKMFSCIHGRHVRFGHQQRFRCCHWVTGNTVWYYVSRFSYHYCYPFSVPLFSWQTADIWSLLCLSSLSEWLVLLFIGFLENFGLRLSF